VGRGGGLGEGRVGEGRERAGEGKGGEERREGKERGRNVAPSKSSIKTAMVYRHKYRRQCVDFFMKNAPKLTCVHM
jgi:hypothetical protein